MPRENKSGDRVLIADCHQDVRNGLVLLLIQSGYTVCAVAQDWTEAVKLLPGSDAEIAILDIPREDREGLALLEALRRLKVPVLVYSMSETPDTIQWAFTVGASGYVTKREDPGLLLEGLHNVLTGRRYLSPRAAQSLASKALSQHTP
jgi:DNA-binding NarL/FixJ family response regulator